MAQRVAEAFFDDPYAIASAAGLVICAAGTAQLGERAEATAAALRRRARDCVAGLIRQVRVHPGRLDIELAADAIAAALGLTQPPKAPITITITAAVTLTRTGRAMRLVQNNGVTVQRNGSPALLRLVLKARRWWSILRTGELNITQFAAAEGVMPAYVTRIVRLAFLSPAVTEAILKGSTRAEVNSTTITAPDAIPACWKAQARVMLPVELMSL